MSGPRTSTARQVIAVALPPTPLMASPGLGQGVHLKLEGFQPTGSFRYLAREHGLIAEGAGAAPVAAILAGTIPVAGQTVAVISGRNITLRALAQVLEAG